MVKQLRKVGNSNALLLDKTLMDLVGLEENAEVQVRVQSGSLIITPVNPRQVTPAQFEAALSRVVTRRRSALKRLAQ
jgi:antitoxin component of MazEF toxin-antitoxin module